MYIKNVYLICKFVIGFVLSMQKKTFFSPLINTCILLCYTLNAHAGLCVRKLNLQNKFFYTFKLRYLFFFLYKYSLFFKEYISEKFFKNNKNWPSYDRFKKKKRYRFDGNTVFIFIFLLILDPTISWLLGNVCTLKYKHSWV